MKLTNKMHDAVLNSEVGQFLDRLIREEVARGGDTKNRWNGNVIQALWAAFMSGRGLDSGIGNDRVPTSFDEIKQGIKDGTING